MKSTLYKKIVVEQYGLTNELSLSDVYTKAKNAKTLIKTWVSKNPTKAKLLTAQAIISLTVSIVKLMQGGAPDEEDIQNIIQKKVETLNTVPAPANQVISSIDKVSDEVIVRNINVTQQNVETPVVDDAGGEVVNPNKQPPQDPPDQDTDTKTVDDASTEAERTFNEVNAHIVKDGSFSAFQSIVIERTSGAITYAEARAKVILSFKQEIRDDGFENDLTAHENKIEDANKAINAYTKLYSSNAIGKGESLNVESVLTNTESEYTYTPNGSAPIDNVHSQNISALGKSEGIQHIIVRNGSGKILYEFNTTNSGLGMKNVHIDAVKFHDENLGITEEEAQLLAESLYKASTQKEVGITAGRFIGGFGKERVNPINEKNDTKEYINGITKTKNLILNDANTQYKNAVAAISNKSKDSLLAKIAYIAYIKGSKKKT